MKSGRRLRTSSGKQGRIGDPDVILDAGVGAFRPQGQPFVMSLHRGEASSGTPITLPVSHVPRTPRNMSKLGSAFGTKRLQFPRKGAVYLTDSENRF